MGLFGIGDDTDTSGSDSGAGFLMPMAAQALQYDPRSALIKSILATGQSQLQQPTYSPMAAIAKALTMGIGGASSAMLQNQYADAAKGAPQEIGAALSSSDPLTALTQSKNPVARMMGFQLAPAIMAKRLEPQKLGPNEILTTGAGGPPLASNKVPLSPEGKLAADIGSPDPIAAAAQLRGAETTAANQSDLQYKPAIAGQTKIAEIPGTVGAAVGAAQGTAPIETFKELFKPQVNRVTGAITIPGVDNPQMVGAIMQQFGVTPKALATDPGVPSVPIAPPPAQGGNQPPALPGMPVPPRPQLGPAPGPSAQGGVAPPAPSPAAMGVQQPKAPQQQPSAGVPIAKPQTPVPVGTMNPIDEVPKVALPTGEMPLTPGTISPGRDPIAIKAGEVAVDQAAKQYEEISDAAKAATSMNAQLNAMKTLLGQGKLITNAAGPAREEVAAWIYAGTGNLGLARSLTGIDPSAADVFNKESTRLGFNLARQLGAREAAQIVQGAIKANPNLASTTEGNKMVIDTLAQGAQHDIDAQKYSDAWFQKNGHYVGAQGWFNQNHPVTEYTSRAIPLQLPRSTDGQLDTSQLQPNVTYQGQNGLGIWNGRGFIPTNPIR